MKKHNYSSQEINYLVQCGQKIELDNSLSFKKDFVYPLSPKKSYLTLVSLSL